MDPHLSHPECPSTPNGAKGAKLILSVDDKSAILVSREQVLRSEGYDVLSAPDGAEALKIFATHPVDLVLLDYSMPGMDGGRVAQNMKGQKPLVPIIMVSAIQVPRESLACTDCFMEKGYGPAPLLEKMRLILGATPNPHC